MRVFIILILSFFFFSSCKKEYKPEDYLNQIVSDTNFVAKSTCKNFNIELLYLPNDYFAITEVLKSSNKIDFKKEQSKYTKSTSFRVRLLLKNIDESKVDDNVLYLTSSSKNLQDFVELKYLGKIYQPIISEVLPIIPSSNFADIILQFPFAITTHEDLSFKINNLVFISEGYTEIVYSKDKIEKFPILKY